MKTRSAALLMACCVASMVSAPIPALAQKEVTVPQAKADANVYGEFPIAYKDILRRWMKGRLAHPESASFKFPSAPRPGKYTTEAGQPYIGYIVEFVVTAQNEFGAYTKEEYRAVIQNGEVMWVGHAVPFSK
jgi:hypothetical protein